MSLIQNIHARQILDSRGNPTLEVDIKLNDGSFGRAAVPSGASTGEHEAVELRDCDSHRYQGKGVRKAVANVQGPLSKMLSNECDLDQTSLDNLMIDFDGTDNKNRFGANAILGVSLAVIKAVAQSKKIPLYSAITNDQASRSKCWPMTNLLEYRKYSAFALAILALSFPKVMM